MSGTTGFVCILAVILVEMTAGGQGDYCTTGFSCSKGTRNVGCKPPVPPNFGPSCNGKSPKDVILSGSDTQHILEEHNVRRQQLAAGKLEGYEPALQMPTLVWDDELAKQAMHLARSCEYGHDECRNTKNFRFAGQNIAIMKYYGYNYTVRHVIDSFVAAWWDEYKLAKQEYVDSYPEAYNGPAIGHFTQMASDRTWKVGCAMMHWLEKHGKLSLTTYYLVCDYSVTNIILRPVYRKGSTPAAECTRRPVAKYNALCAVGEPVDSNLGKTFSD